LRNPNPDDHRNERIPQGNRWVKHAITLLLLLAVVATGSTAYYWRQQWWDAYLSYIHR
jgi:hypothetical protein